MRSLLKKCCLWCSLRVVSMNIGFLYFILGIAGIYLVLSEMAFSNEDSLNNMTFANNTDDTQDSELETGAAWLQIFQLIVSFLTILCAILVLVAVWMNSKSRLLLPWMIFQSLFAVIGLVFTVYYAVLHYNEQDTAMGIGYLVASVSIAVKGFIFLWVIFSYYRELIEVDKNKNKGNLSEEKDEEESIIPQPENGKGKIIRSET